MTPTSATPVRRGGCPSSQDVRRATGSGLAFGLLGGLVGLVVGAAVGGLLGLVIVLMVLSGGGW